MTTNETSFVIQCRTCNEDIVFTQPVRSINSDTKTVRSINLRCDKCGTTHVYTPGEFVPCNIW